MAKNIIRLCVSVEFCKLSYQLSSFPVIMDYLCSSLGGVAKHGSFFGTPSGAIELIDSIKCNGTEVSFAHCSMRIDDPGNSCDDTKLAGVICTMRGKRKVNSSPSLTYLGYHHPQFPTRAD